MADSASPRSEEETFTARGRPSADAPLLIRAITIDVLSGPDAPRTVRAEMPVFVIGSGEGADLRLHDSSVSRRHVRLSLSSDGIVARDDGSKNGTWLGDARLGSALLTSDTLLQVGDSRLHLRLDARPTELVSTSATSFGGAHGMSPAIRHIFALLRRAAATDISVLLEGETGVGKEILADAIHQCSPRHDGPFVAVDCGAIPAALIESELFGHERGAFTGAVQRRVGLFEAAHGGTLFLDEIGELPLELQPKLLRALEVREVRPVGGRAPVGIDVRIIAATNRSLGEAAANGEFRKDLFYRLAVARVLVPPLRDRPEDVILLATKFLRSATNDPTAVLPPDFGAMLAAYTWPGNARELRNVVERFALLGARTAPDVFGHDSDSKPRSGLGHLPYQEARRAALHAFEQQYAKEVLAQSGGVVAQSAARAQMGRASFYRLLERVRLGGVDPPESR